MRSSKSRSRGKSNRGRSVGNVVNRVFDSSGPEGKVRGTPQQIIDKYNQLARDAQLSNDRVAAENFQQHSEHYTRMLSEAQREADARRELQEAQNRERQQQRDQERAERAEQRAEPKAADPSEAPQPDMAARTDPMAQPDVIAQPDVMGMPAVEGDSGLVETPEAKPKRARRPRKPKTEKPAAAKDKPAPKGDTPPEAPEAAE